MSPPEGTGYDATSRQKCAWCGAKVDTGDRPCSALTDTALLRHYVIGSDSACNQHIWEQRRELFEKSPLTLV